MSAMRPLVALFLYVVLHTADAFHSGFPPRGLSCAPAARMQACSLKMSETPKEAPAAKAAAKPAAKAAAAPAPKAAAAPAPKAEHKRYLGKDALNGFLDPRTEKGRGKNFVTGEPLPDFLPAVPGYNPNLPGGGWGGGAWILKKEQRPKVKAVDPNLAKINKDVRVTAWENTDISKKTGWAGILKKNQKPK